MLQKEVLTNLIKEHFKDQQKIRGLEIGVLWGDLDSHLLKEIPNLDMWSIDVAPDKDRLYKAMLDTGVKDILTRFHLIELHSDDAVRALPQYSFDFVWIDGDHEYEQCYKDILNYLPLVKKLGICGGHDLHGFIGGHNCEPDASNTGAHPGVRKSVLEIFGDRPAENGVINPGKVNLGEDFTWWVYV